MAYLKIVIDSIKIYDWSFLREQDKSFDIEQQPPYQQRNIVLNQG